MNDKFLFLFYSNSFKVLIFNFDFSLVETTQLIQSWEELWMDIVPGTEAGLRLYSSDIVAYLQRAITSPSWKLKSQSAAAIGSMAHSLKGLIHPDQRTALLRILLDGLAGRTWEGKHHLLHALASLVSAQPVEDASLKGTLGINHFPFSAIPAIDLIDLFFFLQMKLSASSCGRLEKKRCPIVNMQSKSWDKWRKASNPIYFPLSTRCLSLYSDLKKAKWMRRKKKNKKKANKSSCSSCTKQLSWPWAEPFRLIRQLKVKFDFLHLFRRVVIYQLGHCRKMLEFVRGALATGRSQYYAPSSAGHRQFSPSSGRPD